MELNSIEDLVQNVHRELMVVIADVAELEKTFCRLRNELDELLDNVRKGEA